MSAYHSHLAAAGLPVGFSAANGQPLELGAQQPRGGPVVIDPTSGAPPLTVAPAAPHTHTQCAPGSCHQP